MEKVYSKSVDVAVPVSTAYNQWTQFETFPHFMKGVERIEQISDTKTRWTTNISGVQREFDAEITEQHPDERVAWRTTTGPTQAGVVTFHHLGPALTRVHVQLEFDPEGATEKVGAAVGAVGGRIEADLELFKQFIEAHGPTGGWRGEVPRPGEMPGL